jgi:hypothetical protein
LLSVEEATTDDGSAFHNQQGRPILNHADLLGQVPGRVSNQSQGALSGEPRASHLMLHAVLHCMPSPAAAPA